MKMPGRKGAHKLVMWLKSRFFPGALVLLYHRVSEIADDPFSIAVTPGQFAEHLAFLCHYGQPLALTDMLAKLAARDLTKRSFVITFDDGYADNLYQARPILEQHGVPATFFVVAGGVDSDREFWWDELARVASQPELPGDHIELAVRGRRRRVAVASAVGNIGATRDGGDSRAGGTAARRQLVEQLYRLLLPLDPSERLSVMGEIAARAGVDTAPRQNYRPLSGDEIAELARGNLCEIGAHTLSHSVLSAQSPDRQRREIFESKRRLESILGREVVGFSYPHGMPGDYTVATSRLVKEAGFQYACSGFPGLAHPGGDVFQLPRLAVSSWSRDTLEDEVKLWLGG